MKNEIQTIEAIESIPNDLAITRYKEEIGALQLAVRRLETQKISRLEDSLFSLENFAHYTKVAEAFAKSEIIPSNYKDKPQDIFVAMEMGYQLGLPMAQSLQDIAVIRGRPCLWGDGLLALCLSHHECVSIKEEPIYSEENIIGYRCTVVRKNHVPHTQEFTLDQARKAGLVGNNVWKSYPSRMLQMRARSLALRDKFADALRGFKVAEIEKEDNQTFEGEVIKETKGFTTQTEKLKSLFPKQSGNKESTVEEPKIPKEKAGVLITDETYGKICDLRKNETLSEERYIKALKFFKVELLADLTEDQGKVFLLQINK